MPPSLSTQVTEQPAPGGRLGPFRLESVLGEGSMGIVFRAVRIPQETVVALKVLHDDLAGDEVYRRRFEREGRIAGELAHAHLVGVLETGIADGHPYLAARYVDGPTLAAEIAERGPLTVARVVRLARELGAALDELHRRELLHRDVKPANVMLDSQGAAALTDFGLARGAADTVLTKSGRVVGTVDYLAPEVILGEPATPASDVYALGCVVYECLTGRAPFGDRDYAGACLGHVRDEPADPATVRADVPAEVSWAALRALAKRPTDRPATGRAYARLLAAAARAR